MKKALLSVALLPFFGFSQVDLPFYENFNYDLASSLSESRYWESYNTGDEILVKEHSLSYTGLLNPTGESISIEGKGKEAQSSFNISENQTLYYSLLIQVKDLSNLPTTSKGYFFGFASGKNSYAGSLWIEKTNDQEFKIGLDKNSNSTSVKFSNVIFQTNQTLFVVVRYDTDKQACSLWVNPAYDSFEKQTPPTPNIICEDGQNRQNLNRIIVRQDSASETPLIILDELRIGSRWSEVTPKDTSLASTNTEFIDLQTTKIAPNPIKNNLLTITGGLAYQKKRIEIYSLNGRKLYTTNSELNQIDLPCFDQGIYILKISTSDQIYTQKITIE